MTNSKLTQTQDAAMGAGALLAAQSLTVSIGAQVFCSDLNLTVNTGERLAILGRNGAGKSTLLSTLAGIRSAQAGEIKIKGKTYAQLGAKQSALIRGYLPQTRADAFASTVLETTLVGRHPHLDRWSWEGERDIQIARDALAAVDLSAFEQRDIQTLSGGERQRLAIASLLTQAPELFLLDEPIAHLDLKHQIAMLELFLGAARDCRAGVVMVLHDPALAWRFCDRTLLIYGDGRCESGATEEMLSVERLSALYQYPLCKFERDGRVGFIPC